MLKTNSKKSILFLSLCVLLCGISSRTMSQTSGFDFAQAYRDTCQECCEVAGGIWGKASDGATECCKSENVTTEACCNAYGGIWYSGTCCMGNNMTLYQCQCVGTWMAEENRCCSSPQKVVDGVCCTPNANGECSMVYCEDDSKAAENCGNVAYPDGKTPCCCESAK